LYFRYNESGHGTQNCLYLPTKRPTVPAETGNKKKATKVAVANNKKTTWPQIKKVSNLESANASDLENE